MLQERQADLGSFLTDDEKGKQIPEYLARLAQACRAKSMIFSRS